MTGDEHFLNKLQAGEYELFKLIAAHFPKGIIIDVGAHHGVVTEVFIQENWQAYAFEPIPANLEKMQQQLGESPNLFIYQEAVSDSSGYKNFHLALNKDESLHEFYHSLENIGDDNYHKKGQTIQIKTVSLDDLISQAKIPDQIDFLKVDTEGHDLAVLRGASQLKCSVISVEFWCDNHILGISPSPVNQMVQLLAERDFGQYIIIERLDAYKTSYLYSSLDGLQPDSWGNIFLFHSSQTDFYQKAVNLCNRLQSQHQSQQTLASLTKILTPFYSQNEEIIIADVGAYRGDFTSELMSYFSQAQAILFEPSPAIFRDLVEKFTDNNSVKIFNLALSNYETVDSFYILEDLEQPSSEIKIQVKTLDNFWQEVQPFKRLDILKIDTQGNDLKVIQGAKNIIAQYSPCLLVEAIFVKLYEQQNSYYEIFKIMAEYNYSLTGIYNLHYANSGRLAFADLFFVPNYKLSPEQKFTQEQFICYDLEYLVNQNKFLQNACDERLALINTLHQAAEERLNLINILDAEVKRLQEQLQQLSGEN